MIRHFLHVTLFIAFFQPAYSNTWQIGATHSYTKPSQISSLVQNGDTILIDAGLYANDVARWTAHHLVIKGVGGLAHLKSGGNVYGGKAIWVIVGNDVTVENIEFSEATCPDLNGAGIRSEGINLTVRACYFHHNENGILAGDIASGDFLIEHCEFSGNGYSNGLAHNLYINHANSLIFRYNYSHDAKVGHELKSRAFNNFIYCNRFSDENGTASRNIDLPNGGFSILMGNLIVQDPQSQNSNLVGYGLEGLSNPNSALYVVYNTFVNNKNVGSFLQIANGTPLLKVYNNIFAGPGTVISGTALQLDTLSNRHAAIPAFSFLAPSNYDCHIQLGSIAAGIANDPGMAGPYSLTPTEEYVHPTGFINKASANDAGAFALPIASGVPQLERSGITIYPNPAREFLEVNGLENGADITILDLGGKTWIRQSSLKQVGINSLPPGLFLLNAAVNGITVTMPFIKL